MESIDLDFSKGFCSHLNTKPCVCVYIYIYKHRFNSNLEKRKTAIEIREIKSKHSLSLSTPFPLNILERFIVHTPTSKRVLDIFQNHRAFILVVLLWSTNLQKVLWCQSKVLVMIMDVPLVESSYSKRVLKF